jgi:2-aminoadipate transaminase
MSKQPFLRLFFGVERPATRAPASRLVAAIRDQIRSSPALEGCRLPPVRVLAHQIGVAKGTIQTVYDELKAQGIVESRNREGLFVSRREGAIAPAAPPSSGVSPPKLKPIPLLKRGAPERRPGLLPLSAVFIDPRLLPRKRLADCFRSVLASPGMPGTYDVQGLRALREWIAARLRRRGIVAHADHIVITNGSQQALDIVLRAIATPTIATENPAYAVGKRLAELSGLEVVGLKVDPFSGLDLGLWERQLRDHRPGLVYLTTNFQNPSGYSYTTGQLSQIAAWSRELGFGVLEDDWGSDMLSYSEFRPSLRTLGGENVLYMNSFTKKLLPSLRLGYLLGDERTIETLVHTKRVSSLAVPALVEAGLLEFLERGYYEAFLRTLHEELDARYRHCLDLLDALMPEEVRWTAPGGGPILWLDLPRAISLRDLEERMRRRGVQIVTSEDAFFGEPHLHGFRIGHAYLAPAEMARALELLARELRAVLGRRAA